MVLLLLGVVGLLVGVVLVDVVLVRDGICVDPPLCRGTSQGKKCRGPQILCVLVRLSERWEKWMKLGERELVLAVSVRCSKTQRCAILSLPALEPRVFAMKCDHAVQLCTCCICGCTVHTSRRLSGGFSPGNRNQS